MPEELIEKRTRNGKTHFLGGGKYSYDGSIGSIHYEDNGWQEIDNIFEPSLAPWNWEMLKAGYHIRVKEDFTAGQIIEFEKHGETIQFQPMALEWTNDLDQVQPISMPVGVTPIITNPIVDLLPVVGVPSHQGTIRWNDAYGDGLDFEWKCSSTRLLKILEVESLGKLPTPEQYIIDGGNPILRLNLIFDPSSDIDIYMDDEVWDKEIKNQTFGVVEFRKNGEVLWGFMPLKYWDSVESVEQSITTIEKRGNSLYISIRVPYDWLQSAIYPVFIDTDVDEQVGAGTDDCFRRLSDDAWDLGYTNFPVGRYDATYYQYGGGMRFQTVAIDGDIDVAYLTLKSVAGYGGATVRTRISAEDVDDADTFADDKDAFDTRWANRTTARVDWDDTTLWVVDTDYDSPSIVSVIQEIVDRPGWSSGNDIALFWDDFENRSTRDGAPYPLWVAYSYDHTPNNAPKLHIEYTITPYYPQTSSQAAVGDESDQAWDTPANIEADDDTVAEIDSPQFDLNGISYRLVAQNFGFAIPAGSTIEGIVIEIGRLCDAGSAVDYRVQLLDAAGALIGDNKADTVTAWPGTEVMASYGSSSDKWSSSPTVAMVNDVDFGVVLSVKATANNTDISVDYIRMIIYYTIVSGAVIVETSYGCIL